MLMPVKRAQGAEVPTDVLRNVGHGSHGPLVQPNVIYVIVNRAVFAIRVGITHSATVGGIL